MAGSTGPDIISDGLVLAVDAANTKSYPGSGATVTDLSRRGNTGTLGPYKFYNRALSASEILRNHNAIKSRFGL